MFGTKIKICQQFLLTILKLPQFFRHNVNSSALSLENQSNLDSRSFPSACFSVETLPMFKLQPPDLHWWLRCGCDLRFAPSRWFVQLVAAASRSRSEDPGWVGTDTRWAVGKKPCPGRAACKDRRAKQTGWREFLTRQPTVAGIRTFLWNYAPDVLVNLEQNFIVFEVGVPPAVGIGI